MRPDIVRAARGWIGTPYRHQASQRGAGCDCLGLLRGVWREVCGAEPEAPPAYSMDWDEVARHEVLKTAAARHLTPVAPGDMAEGDVILFRMRRDAVAKHVGICSVAGRAAAFVHAYAGHGVVESPLSLPWRRRIAGVYAFPATEDQF
ncbi:MAG: peptidase [Silicimonas sp.]|nr:peptidase [Silicimonas sp.]